MFLSRIFVYEVVEKRDLQERINYQTEKDTSHDMGPLSQDCILHQLHVLICLNATKLDK